VEKCINVIDIKKRAGLKNLLLRGKKELVIKGKERVTNFSWDVCAEQTQLVYNSLR
jgi:hypothetical protein